MDSVNLVGKTHKQAVEALCHAPLVSKLVIERGQIPTVKSNRASPAPKQVQTSKDARAKSDPVDIMQFVDGMAGNRTRMGSDSRLSPQEVTADNVGNRSRKGSSSRSSPLATLQDTSGDRSRRSSSSRSSPLATAQDTSGNRSRKSSSSRSSPLATSEMPSAVPGGKKTMDLTLSEVRSTRHSPTTASSKTDMQQAESGHVQNRGQYYPFVTTGRFHTSCKLY